jgi:hypothetical protein
MDQRPEDDLALPSAAGLDEPLSNVPQREWPIIQSNNSWLQLFEILMDSI